MNYAPEDEGKEERMIDLILDVVEELPIAPQKEVVTGIKYIYKKQPVVRSFVDMCSELLLNDFLLPTYNLP